MKVAEQKIELDEMTVVITIEQTSANRFEVDVRENGVSIDNENGVFDSLDDARDDFDRWMNHYTEKEQSCK